MKFLELELGFCWGLEVGWAGEWGVRSLVGVDVLDFVRGSGFISDFSGVSSCKLLKFIGSGDWLSGSFVEDAGEREGLCMDSFWRIIVVRFCSPERSSLILNFSESSSCKWSASQGWLGSGSWLCVWPHWSSAVNGSWSISEKFGRFGSDTALLFSKGFIPASGKASSSILEFAFNEFVTRVVSLSLLPSQPPSSPFPSAPSPFESSIFSYTLADIFSL